MKLDTERQGRFLARRVLFKLGRAGTEACRADATSRAQAGALRASLDKLFRAGTLAARHGFACVLTDALGVRYFCDPRELAALYERMEAEQRFRQRESRSGKVDDRNGNRMPAKAEPEP